MLLEEIRGIRTHAPSKVKGSGITGLRVKGIKKPSTQGTKNPKT